MDVHILDNGVQDKTKLERAESFAQWFNPRAEALGADDSELARRIGVRRQAVYNWRIAKVLLDAGNAIRVAEVLGENPVDALVAAGYMPGVDDDQRQQLIALVRYLPEGQLDTAMQFLRFLARGQ